MNTNGALNRESTIFEEAIASLPQRQMKRDACPACAPSASSGPPCSGKGGPRLRRCGIIISFRRRRWRRRGDGGRLLISISAAHRRGRPLLCPWHYVASQGSRLYLCGALDLPPSLFLWLAEGFSLLLFVGRPEGLSLWHTKGFARRTYRRQGLALFHSWLYFCSTLKESPTSPRLCI